MKKGIFWCVDTEKPRLITVSVSCSAEGEAYADVEYSSKAGDNFNHKTEWQKFGRDVTGGFSYNYYPRGRVEIKKRRAVIFLNPDLNNEAVLRAILDAFELNGADLDAITVKSDGSNHYRYQF